jgi:hypothetical protein
LIPKGWPSALRARRELNCLRQRESQLSENGACPLQKGLQVDEELVLA